MNPTHPTIFSDTTLVAVKAAFEASEVILKGLKSNFSITEKSSKQDLVTEIDHASEKTILSVIQRHYPTHSILAEESGYQKNQDPSSPIWIIDPIDGTSNFSRRLPLFVISIAVYHPPYLTSAVIYQPISRELFIAEKGKGAYLNGERLQVSGSTELSHSMIGITMPYYGDHELSQGLDLFNLFIRNGVTIRNFGTAALMLAYVAAGKLDAMCSCDLNPWDIAAGKLLIEEAGGTVTNFVGNTFDPMHSSSLIASNQGLYNHLSQTIRNLQ